MGYESKIIIVLKTDMLKNKFNLTFGIKMAEFNMGKFDYYNPGPFHNVLDKFRDTTCFYYADDGNTEIIKDRYNEFLKEMNIEPFYKIMQKELIYGNHKNQKLKSLLYYLESLLTWDIPNVKNLRVLHYGY